jgi:hypothetical protein
MEGLRKKAITYLGKKVWHGLLAVKEMYKAALGIELYDIEAIIPATLIRHDIVHRNGKTKEGIEHQISVDEVGKLLAHVESFVLQTNTALGTRKVIAELSVKKGDP